MFIFVGGTTDDLVHSWPICAAFRPGFTSFLSHSTNRFGMSFKSGRSRNNWYDTNPDILGQELNPDQTSTTLQSPNQEREKDCLKLQPFPNKTHRSINGFI